MIHKRVSTSAVSIGYCLELKEPGSTIALQALFLFLQLLYRAVRGSNKRLVIESKVNREFHQAVFLRLMALVELVLVLLPLLSWLC